jgi:hypothetical protein
MQGKKKSADLALVNGAGKNGIESGLRFIGG